MASVSFDKTKNRFRIRFVAPNGTRPCLSLSVRKNEKRNGAEKRAHSLLAHVESLIESRAAGRTLDKSLLKWIEGLKPGHRKTLQNAGLLDSKDPGKLRILGPFLEAWMADRASQKQSTLQVWGHAKRNLLTFFGEERSLADITPADADRFERWLIDQEKLADSTVRKRCGFAKQMLQTAVDDRLIESNPLQRLKVAAVGNPDTQYFVSIEESRKVLEACPDAEWRACFALARWGALRIPSEIQELRWIDILWNENRFHVHASKTEHHKERGDRVVPLFPEVRQALNELWDMLGDSPAEFVLPNIRTITNVNPQLGRIIKHAGLRGWPKRWQNLRATRATELERAFPSHVVTRWCGHTERIAKQHYWMTTEGDFEKAACFESVPLVSQQVTESGRKGLQGDSTAHEKSPEIQGSAASYKNLLRRQVEDNGLEPMTSTMPL